MSADRPLAELADESAGSVSSSGLRSPGRRAVAALWAAALAPFLLLSIWVPLARSAGLSGGVPAVVDPARRLILVYGGALHNDLYPRPELANYTFGPPLQRLLASGRARPPRRDIRELPAPSPGPSLTAELAAMRDAERY